jgi:16S rRNA C967 or C1407 C5-methylase (RsmB/RsmF family)
VPVSEQSSAWNVPPSVMATIARRVQPHSPVRRLEYPRPTIAHTSLAAKSKTWRTSDLNPPRVSSLLKYTSRLGLRPQKSNNYRRFAAYWGKPQNLRRTTNFPAEHFTGSTRMTGHGAPPVTRQAPSHSVAPVALMAALGPLRPPGGDALALAEACAVPGPKAVRLNRFGPAISPEQLPFPTRPIAWFGPSGRLVAGSHRPASHLVYATGGYYVQDAGSLLSVAAMDVRPGMLVCDLCASPGGKTTALLELLGAAGGVVANEPIRSRLAPLRINLARHGGSRYTITQADPEMLAERLTGAFDAVLVDAPCSGQSLLGRGRRTRSAYADKTIRHCAARQRRILEAAVKLVRPGGSLVYATCTFAWAENERQVIDLTARSSDWTIERVESLSPWQSPSPSPDGCYRLWPHLHESAGAFASRLRRVGGGVAPQQTPRASVGQSRVPLQVGTWREGIQARTEPLRCAVWPQDVPSLLIHLKGVGPEAAFCKGRTWFPAYGLAMRRDGLFLPDKTTELDPQQALAYVRGEPVRHGAQGWTVVAYQRMPLGWARGDGRSLTNHLPASARLVKPMCP